MLAVASGLALATAACGKRDNASNDPGEANATATDTTVATDTSAPATTDTAAATGATAASSHAAQFLTNAIEADNAEIKAGQAAEDMGSAQAVKDYGKMLVNDHTKAKDQASQVAMALNVPVPTGTPPDADAELKMATSMSGAGFDKDFLAAMIKDHQKAIDMFQQEAGSSDPAQVTDLAKQTLPTLKKHLQKAQSLQK
jgi:putative membrane protein